eukprot:CAMPEP_0206145532 /NCGR_PEP_ID=MMETSP1473-20131121/27659_1 /ASSEMBLY_ACC=CAM_ASM_001109 /TAXON_ID=1461547 /ORGANISM="Stichococcus sp, Strain RCC1054" /LENGTH=263 /DNA_ID=CAMNT_0053541779 /DNA_START=17 /DNA_END=805 /DNA_ORIENTATION=+
MAVDQCETEEGTNVNALAVDDEVLKQFWDLASIDEEIRQKAVETLAERVVKDQLSYTAHDGKPALNGGASDGDAAADKLAACSPLAIYTLKRLVRGLASGRQGARQGFALAVTTIVEHAPAVSAAVVLDLLQSNLPVSASMKGSDATANLLAHVFGCGALVRGGAVQDPAAAGAVTTMLLAAAARKTFLREVATEVLLEMADLLDEQGVLQEVLRTNEALRSLLHQKAEAATPEALLLAVRLWPVIPQELLEAIPLLPPLKRP